MLGARQRVLAPAFHAAQLLAREAHAEHVLAHQVLIGGVLIGLGFDVSSEIAQNLHRTLVGDVRARRVGEPAEAVDDESLDAVGRQQRRRRAACRTRADNHHVRLYIRHALPPIPLA
jgi:hypothetical protein